MLDIHIRYPQKISCAFFGNLFRMSASDPGPGTDMYIHVYIQVCPGMGVQQVPQMSVKRFAGITIVKVY